MKRYVVNYCSAPTGYSWEEEYDSVSEFETFINEMRRTPSASVDVWDWKRKEYIFMKECFEKPEIDLLSGALRDLRTKSGRINL